MRYSWHNPILDLGPYARDIATSIMSSMSDHVPTHDRTDRGRYMLLPEDTTATTATPDPRRPRIRRYRLARFAADGGETAARRPAGDYSYLRRPHD